MGNEIKIITIDGPASSGKTTIAKLLAQKLGFLFLESGSLYRMATYLLLQNFKDIKEILKDEEKLKNFLEKNLRDVKIEFSQDGTKIKWKGKVLKDELRSKEVDENVSIVAEKKTIREILTKFMRELAKGKQIIAEGRDMGSVVFPYADLKVFLTANEEIRAKRRYKEIALKEKRTLEEILENIKLRDKIDSKRKVAPLKIPEGAIIIDTSFLTPEEVLNKILEHIRKDV